MGGCLANMGSGEGVVQLHKFPVGTEAECHNLAVVVLYITVFRRLDEASTLTFHCLI